MTVVSRWAEIDLAANFLGCFTTTSLSPLPLKLQYLKGRSCSSDQFGSTFQP